MMTPVTMAPIEVPADAPSPDEQREQRLAELRELIARHASAKGARVRLEHFRKIKRALLMRDAEVLGATSMAMQEREAYAHPEYLDVVDGYAEATRQESEAYWLLVMEQMRFEAWRTRQANWRAEFAHYGLGGQGHGQK
jgi:hypothetical protein